jgi:pimeloyl-ACP methyl ester carboxylesterase
MSAANDQPFSDFFYPSTDGLRLHARVYGQSAPEKWPVVCLPGLTRNARDFHELAVHLSRHAPVPRQVVAFDYRGRGQSDYDPNIQKYNVGTEAADILVGLAALGIDKAAFIGTSRGGLIIHVLGAIQPAMLNAVVLNDIGPAIEAAGLAHIRSYLQGAQRPLDFAEAVCAQKAAHGADFPALVDSDWHRMVAALYRADGGQFLPDFDPALVETLAGVDFTQPLPTLWPQFDALAAIPMLAIRGEYSKLLSAATFAEMQRRHSGLETIVVPGQGHAPFLETGILPQTIAAFIERAEKQAGARA